MENEPPIRVEMPSRDVQGILPKPNMINEIIYQQKSSKSKKKRQKGYSFQHGILLEISHKHGLGSLN
jgi:hypothetical protein